MRRARRRCFLSGALRADLQRRARAAGAQVHRRFRLVEAVFLQIGRRRIVGDHRLHLRGLQLADQPLDRCRSRPSSAPACVIFQSPPSFAIASVLPPARDVDAVHLLAVELQQHLVAQVERRAVEGVLLERGDREHALLVVALRVDAAAGRRLLADEQLAVVLVARRLEVDLEARVRRARTRSGSSDSRR